MRAIVRSLTGRPFRRAGITFPPHGIEIDFDDVHPTIVAAIRAETRLHVQQQSDAPQGEPRALGRVDDASHAPSSGAPQPEAAPEPEPEAASEPERDADGRVRVNHASAETLRTVRGIGPQLAEAIVARRQKIGPFATLDELVGLPGIGKRSLATLAAKLTCT